MIDLASVDYKEELIIGRTTYTLNEIQNPVTKETLILTYRYMTDYVFLHFWHSNNLTQLKSYQHRIQCGNREQLELKNTEIPACLMFTLQPNGDSVLYPLLYSYNIEHHIYDIYTLNNPIRTLRGQIQYKEPCDCLNGKHTHETFPNLFTNFINYTPMRYNSQTSYTLELNNLIQQLSCI